jgi:hypothetical protein
VLFAIHFFPKYAALFNLPRTQHSVISRLIAEYFANGESKTIKVKAGEKLSIAALVVKYDDFAKAYYIKNGVPTDERYAIKVAIAPLVKLYGSTPADEFGPKRLKAVRQQIISKGRKKDGSPLSRKYINYQAAIIVRIFRWAVEEELVPVSVYQALKTVAGLQRGRVSSVRGVQTNQAGSRGGYFPRCETTVATACGSCSDSAFYRNATRRGDDHAALRHRP